MHMFTTKKKQEKTTKQTIVACAHRNLMELGKLLILFL